MIQLLKLHINQQRTLTVCEWMQVVAESQAKIHTSGQWLYPGECTVIPTTDGRITMQGVDWPVLGIDETGYAVYMQPGGLYEYPGKMIFEIPHNATWDYIIKELLIELYAIQRPKG